MGADHGLGDGGAVVAGQGHVYAIHGNAGGGVASTAAGHYLNVDALTGVGHFRGDNNHCLHLGTGGHHFNGPAQFHPHDAVADTHGGGLRAGGGRGPGEQAGGGYSRPRPALGQAVAKDVAIGVGGLNLELVAKPFLGGGRRQVHNLRRLVTSSAEHRQGVVLLGGRAIGIGHFHQHAVDTHIGVQRGPVDQARGADAHAGGRSRQLIRQGTAFRVRCHHLVAVGRAGSCLVIRVTTNHRRQIAGVASAVIHCQGVGLGGGAANAIAD